MESSDDDDVFGLGGYASRPRPQRSISDQVSAPISVPNGRNYSRSVSGPVLLPSSPSASPSSTSSSFLQSAANLFTPKSFSTSPYDTDERRRKSFIAGVVDWGKNW